MTGRDRASAVVDAQRALAQGGSYRAVRRAALALPAGTSAVATRHALEDALRTAEFNDAGRLIVVRALHLRGLPAGAGGPQLARALERAWQVLAPQARPFDAPGAAGAPAVYFRSLHAARTAWLQRFALDVPRTDWFWPCALPEWAADQHEALSATLAALQTDAPEALAAQVLSWPVAAVQRVLGALPDAALDALMPRWTDKPFAPAARPAAAPATTARLPGQRPRASADEAGPFVGRRLTPTARRLLVALQATFTLQDGRLHWLAALLHRAEAGAWPSALETMHALACTDNDRAAPLPSVAAGSADPTPAAVEGTAAGRSMRSTATPQSGPKGPNSVAEAAVPGVPYATQAAVEELSAPGLRHPASPGRVRHHRWAPWLDDGQSTPFGGLLMLLNALVVLRYPAWLAQQPPDVHPILTQALLARIAGRLRLGETDPHATLFALSPDQQRALTRAELPRCGHRWPVGFDASGLQPASSTVGAALALWQRALVRLLRRHAGIGLAHLVSREAGLSVTPTHVDVVLPLDRADLAIRRAALDRDPGWLPWFGWIVCFHYVDATRGDDA